MLDNFFRINLPYGIAKSDDGKWMAFNREYMPIGFNNMKFKKNPGIDYKDMPIYTKYKGLTENVINKLADLDSNISRNENGEVARIYFYNDGTNPVNNPQNPELWDIYFNKLKTLAKLEIN